jgi:hypothetical protein
LKRALALCVLTLAFAAPAGAQPTGGMGAMQYYVGTWACVGGPLAMAPQKATLTFTVDSGVMRQWVDVPAQGKMKFPYVLSAATSYDAKKGRYVSASLDNTSAWNISVAKPWTGNTERWTDIATNDGKLTHGTIVRTDENDFSYTGYPTLTGTKPNFKVTCKKSA